MAWLAAYVKNCIIYFCHDHFTSKYTSYIINIKIIIRQIVLNSCFIVLHFLFSSHEQQIHHTDITVKSNVVTFTLI